MQRKASVDWNGSLREGKGHITLASGAAPELFYSYPTRFGDQIGTNPEELVASAHASCFTMAVSAELEKLGLKSETLHTSATVTLQKDEASWSVGNIHLNVRGQVPNATPEQFEKAALEAKNNCPISRLLNTNITLETKLLTGKEGQVPKAGLTRSPDSNPVSDQNAI